VATVTLVPHRAPPHLFPDTIAINIDDKNAGITRDILSNDQFPDGTPVAGRAVPILLAQSGIELGHRVGNDFVPLKIREPLDFRSGSLALRVLEPEFPGFFRYTVSYNLNDDPNPPTALADDVSDFASEAVVDLHFAHQTQSDNDAISDDVENGAPNNGDGNHDGIPDSQQDNVASLPDATGTGYVTVASNPGTQLGDVGFVSDFFLNANPPPPGVTLPLGLITFKLLGPFPLDSPITVDVFSPVVLPPPPDFHYYKFGQTFDDPTPHWYDFLFDGQTGAEWISPNLIRLHFISDGGRGEGFAAVGEIDDPGAPALLAPDLALSQTAAPAAPLVGQDLAFTLTVTNRGPNPAPGVVVTDPLPGGVMFVSAVPSQGSFALNNGSLRCDLGRLAPGASATIVVRVRPTAPGPVTNTARVSGALPDPVPGNDVATATATAVPAGPLQRFVTILYAEILDRSPEPQSLEFWVGLLKAGVGPQRVARAIFDSPEHRELVRQHLAPPVTLRWAFLDAVSAERSAATRLLAADDETSHGRPPSPAAVRLASAAIAERFLASEGFVG
jgi:uncharacterized repeat protein (TIGR01451 family)